MNLRIAEAEDYDQLLRLYRQLNPDDPGDCDLLKSAFQSILQSSNLKIIVADLKGKLVGSCYLNIIANMTRGGKPYALIENVITDSEHRNRGIGKAVVDMAIDLARKAHCYKVMLMSGRQDPAVHSFYLKCGFSKNEKQAFIQRLF